MDHIKPSDSYPVESLQPIKTLSGQSNAHSATHLNYHPCTATTTIDKNSAAVEQPDSRASHQLDVCYRTQSADTIRSTKDKRKRGVPLVLLEYY